MIHAHPKAKGSAPGVSVTDRSNAETFNKFCDSLGDRLNCVSSADPFIIKTMHWLN